MTRWKLWALLCAVFFCGIAVGAAGTGYVASHHLGPVPMGPRPGGAMPKPSEIRDFMVGQLARHVGMTDEQKAKARDIFASVHPRFEAVRNRIKPEMDLILEDAAAQIKTFLDTRQQAKLDEFVAQIKKEMPPPGPPPGPSPME